MILPTYVTSQKAAVAYRFAVEKPDVLKYMPCYCGCEKDGHKSNLDCFVKEVKANGAVVYDPMGAG
ncbi:MAG: hypothetical protein HYY09_02465 [Firmicutes bacterium]|nr:hypothetical protein [Bacillota bacterium]